MERLPGRIKSTDALSICLFVALAAVGALVLGSLVWLVIWEIHYEEAPTVDVVSLISFSPSTTTNITTAPIISGNWSVGLWLKTENSRRSSLNAQVLLLYKPSHEVIAELSLEGLRVPAYEEIPVGTRAIAFSHEVSRDDATGASQLVAGSPDLRDLGVQFNYCKDSKHGWGSGWFGAGWCMDCDVAQAGLPTGSFLVSGPTAALFRCHPRWIN